MYRLTAEFDLSSPVGPRQIATVSILHTDDLDLARGVFYKLMDIPEDDRGFGSICLSRLPSSAIVLESWVKAS